MRKSKQRTYAFFFSRESFWKESREMVRGSPLFGASMAALLAYAQWSMVNDSPTAHLLFSLHLGSFMIQARGT